MAVFFQSARVESGVALPREALDDTAIMVEYIKQLGVRSNTNIEIVVPALEV